MIELATVTDARYLPWCATMLWSAARHSKNELRVHVLHDGSLSGRDESGLQTLADQCGFELLIHRVPDSRLESFSSTALFGRIVWLRLLLPELLASVPRVLYLDADTYVVESLKPLWETDLRGIPLGAVSNVTNEVLRQRLNGLGIPDAHGYFNSGVLLMDLDAWRKNGWHQKMLDCVSQRGHSFLWPDQDTLNVVFHGHWHLLHPRWNCQNTLFFERAAAEETFGPIAVAEAVSQPGILHFEGPGLCKPWHFLSPHPWASQYRASLANTPWADTPLVGRNWINRAIAWLPAAWRVSAYLRVEVNKRRLGLPSELA